LEHSKDHITVGMITLPYSFILGGWVMRDGSVITNPITAQNTAERLNNASKTVH
jgi:hypothetical protein